VVLNGVFFGTVQQCVKVGKSSTFTFFGVRPFLLTPINHKVELRDILTDFLLSSRMGFFFWVCSRRAKFQ
jgi:hypothetical protein